MPRNKNIQIKKKKIFHYVVNIKYRYRKNYTFPKFKD